MNRGELDETEKEGRSLTHVKRRTDRQTEKQMDRQRNIQTERPNTYTHKYVTPIRKYNTTANTITTTTYYHY